MALKKVIKDGKNMRILGIDGSTKTIGWAICNNKIIENCDFIDVSKNETNKEKSFLLVSLIKSIPNIHHINLESPLFGFGFGKSSQQTIVKLIKFNAILEYILSEELKIPVILCNVNTARKIVLGKSRIKGVKPKEYVKTKLPQLYPDVKKFEKLNRNGDWDAHNSDMYDAVICALFG